MSDEQAAAGWFPVEGGRLRYWDGSAWTEHFFDPSQAVAQSGAETATSTSRLKGAASSAARQLTSNDMELPEGTLWSAIGKGLGGITTGRYRMDIHYLYFAKGAVRTDAQQIPVSGIADVDVRQSMTQKARGVWSVIVHVRRANGTGEIVSMDDIPNGPEAQRALNRAAHDARLLLEHRSIHLDGLRHQVTNTTRQEISYQGGVPFTQPGFVAPMQVVASPQPVAQIEGGDPIIDVVAFDPIAQLKDLAGLHQAGILTDEEFTTKKAEILARM